MAYTTETVRTIDDETLTAEIEDVELQLSELGPQLAKFKVTQGETADIRTLFDANFKIEELEERWQELTEAFKVLTTERNKRS